MKRIMEIVLYISIATLSIIVIVAVGENSLGREVEEQTSSPSDEALTIANPDGTIVKQYAGDEVDIINFDEYDDGGGKLTFSVEVDGEYQSYEVKVTADQNYFLEPYEETK